MSDSYQAIFDAVRSRISGGDVGAAVREAAERAFDISFVRAQLQQDFSIAAAEMARPSVVYRADLRHIGGHWFAAFGDLRGAGATPDEAMRNFDTNWYLKEAS